MCFKKSYKIHPINFKTPKKDFKTNECIICLEKITYGRAVLNCGHHFHSTCVLKWFERNVYYDLRRKSIQILMKFDIAVVELFANFFFVD